ncbi:MAG: hypothetical protein ABIG20_00475 [archaeon]
MIDKLKPIQVLFLVVATLPFIIGWLVLKTSPNQMIAEQFGTFLFPYYSLAIIIFVSLYIVMHKFGSKLGLNKGEVLVFIIILILIIFCLWLISNSMEPVVEVINNSKGGGAEITIG